MQTKKRLSNLFHFKDVIPNEPRSHIVYKFLYSNCYITYYGETERHLKVRSGEHLSLSALTGKRVNNEKKSAVKDHILLNDHVCSFEDFSILAYESNTFKLLIKESLLVSRAKPLLNEQVKSIPSNYLIIYLIIFYCSLDDLYCLCNFRNYNLVVNRILDNDRCSSKATIFMKIK